MSKRLQARQAPVSSWVSSHRFRRILQVQQPDFDLGGAGVTVEVVLFASERRRVRFRGMAKWYPRYKRMGWDTDGADK